MALVDGGDLVARAIKLEGVDTIFTLCGGHVQAIYDACLDEEIKVIDVRHEQVAGHAAEGWSPAPRRRGLAPACPPRPRPRRDPRRRPPGRPCPPRCPPRRSKPARWPK